MDAGPFRFLNPRYILILGMIANACLFVRVAVLHSPQLSYRGPTGEDRLHYYAYVRSLVIDGDLDFANEFEIRPPNHGLLYRDGRPLNKYPIGTPLLSLPAYAATHLVVTAINATGLGRLPSDGYSAPYALSFALSQMAWALFGIWILYRTLLRYFDTTTAAMAVVATWFSTNVLHYTSTDLMLSHSAALFSVAWCSYASVRLVESPGRGWSWFCAGASSALVVLVRFQNGVYLLVPFCAGLTAIVRDRRTLTPRQILTSAALGLAGICLVMAPQLFVWKAVYGTWITNTYRTSSEAQRYGLETAWMWTRPRLVDVLFNRSAGLLIWLPAIVLGIVGCFATAARRRDVVAAAAGISLLTQIYVASAWWAWDYVAQRSPFDLLFPLCLGFGYAITRLGRWGPAIPAIVIALLIAWSVPFVAVGGLPVLGPQGSEPASWLDCILTLLRLNHV